MRRHKFVLMARSTSVIILQRWRDKSHAARLQAAGSNGRGSPTRGGAFQFFFTPAEGNSLEDACVHFRLTPRAAKRIVNVLKLIRKIHF